MVIRLDKRRYTDMSGGKNDLGRLLGRLSIPSAHACYRHLRPFGCLNIAQLSHPKAKANVDEMSPHVQTAVVVRQRVSISSPYDQRTSTETFYNTMEPNTQWIHRVWLSFKAIPFS